VLFIPCNDNLNYINVLAQATTRTNDHKSGFWCPE
jgi:hypothetical protein